MGKGIVTMKIGIIEDVDCGSGRLREIEKEEKVLVGLKSGIKVHQEREGQGDI